MIMLLLAPAVMVICGFVGWLSRDRRAKAREQQLLALVAKHARAHDSAVAAARRMWHANQRLAELYIDAVGVVDPDLAAGLRRIWARVEAPQAVARLLQRARHG